MDLQLLITIQPFVCFIQIDYKSIICGGPFNKWQALFVPIVPPPPYLLSSFNDMTKFFIYWQFLLMAKKKIQIIFLNSHVFKWVPYVILILRRKKFIFKSNTIRYPISKYILDHNKTTLYNFYLKTNLNIKNYIKYNLKLLKTVT